MKEHDLNIAQELIVRRENVKDALANVKICHDDYTGSNEVIIGITTTHTTNRTKKHHNVILHKDKLLPVLELELHEIRNKLKKLGILKPL